MDSWMDSDDEDEEEMLMEAEAEVAEEAEELSPAWRMLGLPAGLKNLGNTCYVNSFLQIWFHNVPFR